VLGDLFTLIEKRGIKNPEQLKKAKVVFVGDGNNMSNSWIAAAGLLGFHFVLARPRGYGPNPEILKKAQSLAKISGGEIEIVEDPLKAVKGADVIYTDVWISMGDEGEQDKRRKAFRPYQINQRLVGIAKKDVMVMHCLPAVRGEEITDQVMDGPSSVIFDEAENRLHIQKAILVYLLR
jgi:ornithine carbamoyltransferase